VIFIIGNSPFHIIAFDSTVKMDAQQTDSPAGTLCEICKDPPDENPPVSQQCRCSTGSKEAHEMSIPSQLHIIPQKHDE
jgi:hypothetical protein